MHLTVVDVLTITESVMHILVTGANGFIGSRLCYIAKGQGLSVAKVLRSSCSDNDFIVGGIDGATDYTSALEGIDCVVHLAARVHVMQDTQQEALDEYRKINVDGTLNLARQAVDAGVKRFIFLSSIKVNGESTKPGQLFTADGISNPQDAYAVSKEEAECGLFELSMQSKMEVVCIRPPLVYGPGVKANFAAMMYWLYKGIPLPFGVIHNKRSVVALDNLVDLILTCMEHPAAGNQVFLVSDGEDLSTTELLRRTAVALGRSPRLLPVPQELLQFAFRLLGKRDLAQRLCGSLQVDISKTCTMLGWSPLVSVDEGLLMAAEAFLRTI